MDAEDLVSVYTVNDPNKAEIIKNVLVTEGIRCELDGERQAGFTGLFEINLMVRKADAERALEIIESHDDSSPTE